ncbi:MAG TPA: hypothetical protein V6C81_13720 [Planktothrix sp.]
MLRKTYLLLLIAAIIGILFNGSSRADQNGRVVSFPKDKSLGNLMVVPSSCKVWPWLIYNSLPRPFLVLGRAQGNVTIPKGMDLYLDANYVSAENPAILATIPTDALSGLRFIKVETDERQAAAAASKFPNLKAIDFRDTDLNNEDLKQLRSLHKLTALSVRDSEVTGPGLQILSSFPLLEHLSLDNDDVGSAGMKWIGSCKTLRLVTLDHSKVTDSEISNLAGLPDLAFLDLNGNPGITAKSFSVFARLKHLRHLGLKDTGVKATDVSAIQSLARQLPELIEVNLRHASFTPDVVADLHKRMPKIHFQAAQHNTDSGTVPEQDVDRVFAPLHSWSGK